MAAAKFTEAEREKLFAQLEAAVRSGVDQVRVMRTPQMPERRHLPLPIRAPTRTGSTISYPSDAREYTISTVPSLCA